MIDRSPPWPPPPSPLPPPLSLTLTYLPPLMIYLLPFFLVCILYNRQRRGPWWGVPNVACRFLEMAMSHVSVAYFPLCHMSSLRNEYVPCHYIFSPHVACHKALCHMSNFRNAHVTLSILGFKGHNGKDNSWNCSCIHCLVRHNLSTMKVSTQHFEEGIVLGELASSKQYHICE